MKVLIMTDIECITGVDDIDMIFEGEGYEKAREYLMEDLNVAVKGAIAGGADEIYVVDGHYKGENFIKEMLTPEAKQITCQDFFKLTSEGFDAILSVGQHSKAGTVGGFLDHTQSSTQWFDYKVNGKSIGEMGQLAIWGAAFGVPLVMLSGDVEACKEAEEMVPGVKTAVVKKALKRNTAVSIPKEEAHERIFNAARDGVRECKSIKPYSVTFPARVEITFTRNDYCDDKVASSPEYTRDGRTAIKTVNKALYYRDVM